MAISFPVGPASVPSDLTQPPATYRRRVALALAGLVLFLLLYLLLTGWLGFTAYRLMAASIQGGNDSFWGFVVGACAAFLTIFMVKGIFFVKHGRTNEFEVEVTAADQPALFEFLHRLADQTGAPRPHRVFLSSRVNASVSYDLSLLNLLFPSKKNLEIGLGLVNTLTLGELKAVLAHEFGHFTQRSMAVGRWVATAQQIAARPRHRLRGGNDHPRPGGAGGMARRRQTAAIRFGTAVLQVAHDGSNSTPSGAILSNGMPLTRECSRMACSSGASYSQKECLPSAVR